MKKLKSLAIWMLFASIWYLIPYPVGHDNWIAFSRFLFYTGSFLYLFCWAAFNETN